MQGPTPTMLRIGAWCVNPASSEISRNGETARVEARTMRLLLCLAEHAGAVVSIDDLLSQVWPDVTVSPDSVYQAVTSLRRLLGDDPRQPTYIATVPRLGYRMVAEVSPWTDAAVDGKNAGSPQANRSDDRRAIVSPIAGRRTRAGFSWAAAALCVAVVVVIAFLLRGKVVNDNHPAPPAAVAQPQKSIAVLPFLDLTEKMNEEPFADGMTEELIDRLSKIPGLQVPSATSSFYFKGKKMTVADIAKSLGVAYVLDGSVRKSGTRIRVAARLIRADNGYVVWSESYDRPTGDILWIQDDIASEATKALRASIESPPQH
jgi:transcriptional activator of cad operon